MQKPIIKLDEPRAKSIKFTSDLFDHGIIWDRFPYGVYIDALYPREGCFVEAVEAFFGEIDRVHLRFRYTAPHLPMELYLIKRGYKRYVDAPGTPFYTNTFIPKSCVEAPRTAEEIETLERIMLQSGNEYAV